MHPTPKGMVVLMVLVSQLILSLWATAAWTDSVLQQKMIAQGWQDQVDELSLYQSFYRLEHRWQQNQLHGHAHSQLGIAHHDCALSAWLGGDVSQAPWALWHQQDQMIEHYLIINWASGVCHGSETTGSAYTLVLIRHHPNRPERWIQSMWLDAPRQRVYWRSGDSS